MILAALLAAAATTASLWDRPFEVSSPSEAVAIVKARCQGCSWASRTRTGAMLVLSVDGQYSQHIALTRGEGPAEYRVALGGFDAGRYRLQARVDGSAYGGAADGVAVDDVRVETFAEGTPEHRALALSPVLHARPNAVGRFTDVPLLMWYETEPTNAGSALRYSVVFSHEDGGTKPDRLLATWGRLTDIEFAYGVEIDRDAHVVRAEYQARDHQIVLYRPTLSGRPSWPWRGRTSAARRWEHPPLWVVTDNNMLGDRGTTEMRFAPAAFEFDPGAASREAVMDAHPWTYGVSAQEALREGWVADEARLGSGRILDPRRYLYVEACAETTDAALAFAAAIQSPDGEMRWQESDGGQAEFRIVRYADNFPNGCFRGAVPVPDRGTLRALRFRAHTRAPRRDEAPLPPGTGSAQLLRINRVFRLTSDGAPGPDLFTWRGRLSLKVGGPAEELPLERPAGWAAQGVRGGRGAGSVSGPAVPPGTLAAPPKRGGRSG